MRRATAFECIAAIAAFPGPFVGDDGKPEQIVIAGVTPNFFTVLGARIAFGRNFVEADGRRRPRRRRTDRTASRCRSIPRGCRRQITILSHSFWQRKFGGDSSVIGKTIQIFGRRGDDRRCRGAGAHDWSSRPGSAGSRAGARRLSRRFASTAATASRHQRALPRRRTTQARREPGDGERAARRVSRPTSNRAFRSRRRRTRCGTPSRCRRTSSRAFGRRFSRSWAR